MQKGCCYPTPPSATAHLQPISWAWPRRCGAIGGGGAVCQVAHLPLPSQQEACVTLTACTASCYCQTKSEAREARVPPQLPACRAPAFAEQKRAATTVHAVATQSMETSSLPPLTHGSAPRRTCPTRQPACARCCGAGGRWWPTGARAWRGAGWQGLHVPLPRCADLLRRRNAEAPASHLLATCG